MIGVSVVIPTWNRGLIIEKAIKSALNQTYPPLEILVCDDGSTDNTEEAVKSFKDLRVRWLPGPRRGWPSFPRNRGIRESKGKWIAFLDSDDEWLPEKLERQLTVAEKLNCKAICSQAYKNIPGKGIQGNLTKWRKYKITFEDLLIENQIICSSVLILKNLFDLVKGFPEDKNVIEDYALWLRVTTQTDFAFINVPLVIYSYDFKKSISGMIKMDNFKKKKYIFDNFLKWGSTEKISSKYIYAVRRKKREILLQNYKKRLKKMLTFLKRYIF